MCLISFYVVDCESDSSFIISLDIGNILCSFEQMGIFDELVKVSKPTYDATYYSAELKKTAHICVQDEM